MSTVTENEPDNATQAPPVEETAREMRQTMGAVKLSFTWMGTRRKLEEGQIRTAADAFDADRDLFTASKKLIDTKHPAYKAVSVIKSQAASFWRSMTLPYPQDGVRLIRHDDIERFEATMSDYRTRLADAVENLREHYETIKANARERLGRLYNPADYPATLEGTFGITWEYPPIEPPRYLMNFNPELYEQEQARIQQRFEQAVTMAEDAFAEKLQELVEHLIERLSDTSDGKPKTFQKSTVENFREFYEEFRRLNVRGNTELDALVSRANNLVAGVDAQDLRNSAALRQNLSEQMGEVRNSLDTLIANAPRRRIMRLD